MSYSRFMSCALFTLTPNGGRRSTSSRSPTRRRYVRFECPLGNWRTETGPAAFGSMRRRNGSIRAGSIRSSSRISAGWSRVTSIAAFVSQPGGLRLQAGGIERIEQRRRWPDPRQLPAEEVAARGELALGEVRVRSAGERARRGQRLTQPHPCAHDVAQRLEVGAGVREPALNVARHRFTETPRSRDQPLHGLAQFRAESAQRLLASGGLDVRPHRTREEFQRLSPAAQRFAPEQVERLDAVRPFVDG